ncbi:bifunctional phosphoglucose/phosphomannose isomerase [Caldivirga maquilingensis]|uniref:Bifunctional phosphoglucose/phosphomannose isomerase n=1 Tax=Caldivirga maquilingensis (strain ATCC 700844 / DSM 13496 / JCM 10307 / IC-167) TaxID=397948 RepID=A8MBZ9_CALMQ|nr:bifunctional phosphoglucose/phosphomannose isomerase [Caldivirga maquilingensis]ABW02783.1 bifunctional phosphoglucose/phosphomannose isomerase [Caldivirga maquilingensis IC-167]
MPYGYEEWPKLSLESFKLGRELNLRSIKVGSINYDFEPSNIVITGMGGSGIVGDIVRDSLWGHNIIIHKDFNIPKWVDSRSLVVAVSYSGETLETICGALDALRRGVPVVGVTTGGRLASELEGRGAPVVKVPKAIAPRFGLPNLLYAVLGLLSHYLTIPEIDESISVQGDALRSELPGRLASFLKGYVPMIFAPIGLQAVAYRFKNDLNENSKTPAVVAIVPEADHNDIVAVMLKHPVKYIIIRGRTDDVHDYLMRAVEEVVKNYSSDVEVVELKGSSRLSQEVYGSMLLGLVSVKLAELYGIDPVRTDPINTLKEKIRGINCPSN